MTMEPTGLNSAEHAALARLAEMLTEVTGSGPQRAAEITASSRLEGDLGLDSVDLVALGELLRAEYGDRVDIAAFLAGLDIDQLIGVTAGDLAAYVVASRAAGSPARTR